MRKYLQPLPSVAIFDPSLATRNAGDEIIAQAARAVLTRVLPDAFQATLPTHERLGLRSWRFCHQASHRIVAGSNILTGAMLTDRQWRLRPWDLPFVTGLTLLGVGWRAYQARRRWLSDAMLRRILAGGGLHSVRDAHTRSELERRGIRGVLNTGCVTMWDLKVETLAALPRKTAPFVVTTVNVGHRGPQDTALLELLFKEYQKVMIWPQGIDDSPYCLELKQIFPDLIVLGPTLAAYDDVLARGDTEFVGNRLHGGIRALQHGRRALILSVDNRAVEIARDTGLPVMSLANGAGAVRARLRQPDPIEIVLPDQAIADWQGQFT